MNEQREYEVVTSYNIGLGARIFNYIRCRHCNLICDEIRRSTTDTHFVYDVECPNCKRTYTHRMVIWSD